ncbi:hypothetical protein TNCV_760891 [Trichonephila clavipes]|nr:hypothetical protein TNCV_760891 [Trichonephila clavipes]
MLEKVIENWTSRLDYIRASRGSHMPEIIFKILGGVTVDLDKNAIGSGKWHVTYGVPVPIRDVPPHQN